MFSHGNLVPTICIKDALLMFSDWLTSLNEEIILIGHNIKAFDVKHLLRHIRENKMDLVCDKIVAYIDTLPLFKFLFPNETSYSQVNLYRRVIVGEYNAHNSLDDVKDLAELLRFLNVDNNTLEYIQYDVIISRSIL